MVESLSIAFYDVTERVSINFANFEFMANHQIYEMACYKIIINNTGNFYFKIIWLQLSHLFYTHYK